MLKAEIKDEGVEVVIGNATHSKLLTEFEILIEQMYKHKILDKNLYNHCWELATRDKQSQLEYMKDEIKKAKDTYDKQDKEIDDILKELMEKMNNM